MILVTTQSYIYIYIYVPNIITVIIILDTDRQQKSSVVHHIIDFKNDILLLIEKKHPNFQYILHEYPQKPFIKIIIM